MDNTNDKLNGFLRVPYFLDSEHVIGIRVHWVAGTTTSGDTIDWTVLLDFRTADQAIIDAASALDTVIAQDTYGSGTAYHNKWTARGLKNKDFLTRAQVEAGAMMIWSVKLTATDIDLATEKVWLLGIDFDFVRHDFVGGTDTTDIPLSSIV